MGLALIAALVALAAGAQEVRQRDSGPPGPSVASPPAAGFKGVQVPSGGRPLLIAHDDAIPRQLKQAVERADCVVTNALLAQFPVLIFRPADGRRVMAVVPCFGRAPGSRAFLFDDLVEHEPTLMTFPVVALTGGISASSRPGLMNWDPQTATLTAWQGSESCPARELRHIYRQGRGDLNGFALSRIEHRQLRCTTPEAEWQTLWQSPVWKLGP